MRLIKTVICIFICVNLNAQTTKHSFSSIQIIGSWQIGNSQVSDAFKKNIIFYKNGKFILNYDGYDDIGRIRSVSGHYKIKDTALYLTIESRMEIAGGKLTKGSPGFQTEEFTLDGGKLITIKQTNKESDEPFDLSVSEYRGDNPICIQIDNNKYYKLSVDPNK